MKLFTGIAVAAFAVGTFAVPASAQVFGMPVNYAPIGTGVTIHGGVGRGLNDDSGKQTALGGGVAIGLPTFQVGAVVSYINVGDVADDEELSFGGHAAYGLPLPPTTPVDVAIVAGIGVLSVSGTTQLFVPAGVSLAFDVPSPSVSVTPWVSPQIRIFRASAGGFSSTTTDFGVSGGLSVTLPMGFGFHALADYDNGSSAFSAGGGVHFTIAVPSLAGGM